MEEDTVNTAELLVDKYADTLFRIAIQNTGVTQEAEDIVQDVFLAMLKNLPFESEEHAKRWLIRVTVNKCRDYLRAARRKNLPLEENIAGTYCHQDSDVLQQLQKLQPLDRTIVYLFQQLQKLQPLDRTIVYLFYFEGYNAKEIAKMVGKTRNAVTIRLMRAREALKGLLEEE